MTFLPTRVAHALAWPLMGLLMAGCGSGRPGVHDTSSSTAGPLPQLGPASPGRLQACESLAQSMAYPHTVITAATRVPAERLKVAGAEVGEHCLVTGRMFDRVSPVDGERYAIGFEMRLPVQWNGRFFYQANGGTDGNVVPATGEIGGGGPLTNGLREGFAVLSSDAGHSSNQNPLFGLDPQARLDYGYQAVGKLTPMAKAMIRAAYGRPADRSYMVGCSNGGRHALVAASRYAGEYDGILAGNPGFQLPRSGVAMIHTAQQFSRVATDPANLATAFTPAERALVARTILDKCDALDGARDGQVNAIAACRQQFDLVREVPSCRGARDGQCLTDNQKQALASVYRGPQDSRGRALYAAFPYDPGLTSANWAQWRFAFPLTLSAGNMAVLFRTPPAPAEVLKNRAAFALGFDMDRDAPLIEATDARYTESAMAFMAPPHATDLRALRGRGAKLIVYHGMADGTFSPLDTARWYDELRAASGPAEAADFSRLFLVPGMAHCGAGPATDQFDLLGALVAWVERGQPPDGVVAQARGPGNAGGANADVPADWSPTRTRPLCAFPAFAQYKGQGSLERADSFVCRAAD
nr:tannase/feruloyl esterase family alpha/beta hydrolase [Pseudacidovorax intermedius]